MLHRIIIISFLLVSPASAEWRQEYAAQPPSVRDWYANAELTLPAQRRLHFKRCCDHTETVKTKFRIGSDGDDGWQFLKPDGTWASIPPDIIHWNESGPRGEAVLFQLPNGVLTCFFPAAGGG